MTKGTKSTPAMMSEYLANLFSYAADVADPASVLLSWMYDCTNVLGHVASHARHRPIIIIIIIIIIIAVVGSLDKRC